MSLTIGALVAGLTVPLAVLAVPAQAGVSDTTLVSRAPDGAAGNGRSSDSEVSGDGRFVAFISDADNLSGQDDNAYTNVYRRDLDSGTTILVSTSALAAADGGARGDSTDPSISFDGRYVAFASDAANLGNGTRTDCINDWGEYQRCVHVFVRDMVDDTTTLVSRASDGTPADGTSAMPALSPDGQRVVFQAAAPNLSNEDQDICPVWDVGDVPCTNVHLRDLAAGTTTFLMAGGASKCGHDMSPDGKFAAIEAWNEIFVVNLTDRTKTSVSQGVSSPSCPSISRDGLKVAFAGDLHNGGTTCSSPPGGCNNGDEVYVRNVQAGTTTAVTRHDNFPAYGHKPSNDPSISADGRYVAFDTTNPNLSPAGAGAYVRDLTTTDLTFVSRATGSTGEAWPGTDPSLSGDGRMVSFTAQPSGYDYPHVFAREWTTADPPPWPQADLSLTLTVSDTTPAVGSQVTYTATVANAGPDGAGEIRVGGDLWFGSNLVSATSSQGSYDTVTGLWTVGSIAAGGSATLKLVVKITTAGTSKVGAGINNSDTPDPDSSPKIYDPAEDDQASVTITATQPACGSVTKSADRDSWIRQSTPSNNYGTNTVLKVQSRSSANARALVRVPLPAVPSGCKLSSAKLRLYASTAATGRTLRLNALGSSWTETGVTWNNQPAITGTAVTASSRAGWVGWTVTGQVNAMYTGANHGFRIRDNTESASGYLQQFNSRESTTNPPELIVTFTPL